jgi:hypothetical protein
MAIRGAMSEAGWTGERLRGARLAAGMSQGDIRGKLIRARRQRGNMPPKEASLKRMYTDWESGRVMPSEWRDELCDVLELPPAALGFIRIEHPEPGPELPESFEVTRIDPTIVRMLDQQTDLYRLQDRLLGAAIIPQTEAHVHHLEQLIRNAMPGRHQASAAVVLAEAAALSGWQSLDAGNPKQAWAMHDIAKQAARLGEDATVLAHVTAQQGYVLLDAGRPADAVELISYVTRPQSMSRIPPRMQSWLAGAKAEFLAAAGDESGALRMLDHAEKTLPAGEMDPTLPYVMLNAGNLARWRGHCLARLGHGDAIAELSSALEGQTLTSRRAECGLRVDLALAFRKIGDVGMAAQQAKRAAELAGSTGSARQRSRIARLVAA